MYVANSPWSGNAWLSSYNAVTGQEIWRNEYAERDDLITPELNNGTLYSYKSDYPSYLRALNADSGSLFFRYDQNSSVK